MKALLLDLGGVVIDVDPQRCFEYWAEAAGVDVEHIAVRWRADEAYEAFEIGAIGFDEYLVNLSTRLGISLEPNDWRAGWNALLGDPIAEIVAALPALAARVPLYCFSNTNVVHQAAWERRHAEALTPFRRIYVSWQLGMRKPSVLPRIGASRTTSASRRETSSSWTTTPATCRERALRGLLRATCRTPRRHWRRCANRELLKTKE